MADITKPSKRGNNSTGLVWGIHWYICTDRKTKSDHPGILQHVPSCNEWPYTHTTSHPQKGGGRPHWHLRLQSSWLPTMFQYGRPSKAQVQAKMLGIVKHCVHDHEKWNGRFSPCFTAELLVLKMHVINKKAGPASRKGHPLHHRITIAWLCFKLVCHKVFHSYSFGCSIKMPSLWRQAGQFTVTQKGFW